MIKARDVEQKSVKDMKCSHVCIEKMNFLINRYTCEYFISLTDFCSTSTGRWIRIAGMGILVIVS